MKKFYTWFLTLVLAALPALAQSFTIPFVVDDASRVIIEIEDIKVPGLISGTNQIHVISGQHLTVRAAQGCKLTSVREVYDTGQYELQINEGTYCYINIYGDYGSTYYIESAVDGDVRTSVAHLTVDNPDKVIVSRGPDRVGLVTGVNDIPFDPASEAVFRIEPVDYDVPLYSLKHNEKAVQGLPPYTLAVADGDRIDILADYPDVRHTITLEVEGDYPDNPFITGLFVDGTPVTAARLASEGAPAGSLLSIAADTRNFEVLGFTVNGVNEHFGDGWHTAVLRDMALRLRVSRYAMVRVQIQAGPHVNVYRGQHYDGDLVSLDAEGHATVDVPRDAPILTFIPHDGYHLATLTVSDSYGTVDSFDPEDLKAAFTNVGMLDEGDVVAVTAAAFVRDRRSNIVIDNYAKAADYMSVIRADGSKIEPLAEGHNQFLFDPWDTPVTLQLGGPCMPYVYLNDEASPARFPGSFDYDIIPVDGDVIKVFFDRIPALYDVHIDIDPTLQDVVVMRRDRIGLLGTEARVLDGTELTFNLDPAVNHTLDVVVDGTQIERDTDGLYRVIVHAAHRIVLTQDAAVTDIAADATAAPAQYYDLLGRPVTAPAPGMILIKRQGSKVSKVAVK